MVDKDKEKNLFASVSSLLAVVVPPILSLRFLSFNLLVNPPFPLAPINQSHAAATNMT